ncbi:hypothetical protein N7509_005160 [Penicillium cosmopolitanum]|uniref:Amidohydrolase-related domain-containing protein n=1 Tax=Penicillium cosmopolitanum TaxID=1131564 RepID=A0A9W9W1W3_9EURO|nr:uncharacterized protein N7509_005160 [Penicillium cosmopolitanum]KAJ5397047.1 hypothetical protein N7509_005160 [Penicillium cosmopolitanum]
MSTATQENPVTAITNVRVFDGQRICDPSTVFIDGELIGGPDAIPNRTIDAQGAILLPGLIDCHIHLHGPEDLARMTEFGVTTALDMATWPIELLQSLRGREGVTDIRGCGVAATAPGSVHSRIPTLPRDALVSNAVEAKRFVTDRIAEGADYIKIVADVPGPDQETLNALVANAHLGDKLVVAHAVSLTATEMSQLAGVDFITHAPLDGVITDQDIQRMLESKRISIPTLTMMIGVARATGRDFENARKTVAALHLAGVPILAGTDSNKAAGVPSNVSHGISLHEELALLVDCGLSTTEALRAATSLPAKYFGLNDRGVIKPGYRADLILIQDNPIEDIKATRSITRVWIAGQECC